MDVKVVLVLKSKKNSMFICLVQLILLDLFDLDRYEFDHYSYRTDWDSDDLFVYI